MANRTHITEQHLLPGLVMAILEHSLPIDPNSVETCMMEIIVVGIHECQWHLMPIRVKHSYG